MNKLKIEHREENNEVDKFYTNKKTPFKYPIIVII